MSTTTSQLLALRERYVPSAFRSQHPVIATRGEGAWLWDAEGNRYLDFASGISVLNVGQRHPLVVESVRAQIDRLMHTGPVLIHDAYIQLAARLAERVDPARELQVLFLNSGAEAVENAVKVARHATGRTAVIAFEGSFHGRTLLASTLTGKVSPYKTQPGALAPEIYFSAYPDTYRTPVGVAAEFVVPHCLERLERLLQAQISPDRVAAIVVEPIQGEGGYIVPPRGFLTELSKLTKRIGALLILDEIQSGLGRTGKLFAREWEPVTPDILVCGKSIADGLPLAAIVAPREVFDKVVSGDVGGTYTGNPVACAAGLAVMDLLDDESLLDRAQAIGRAVRSMLEEVAEQVAWIGEVRGLGAMMAVECVKDRESKAHAADMATHVATTALKRGLIVIKAGVCGNVIRLLPPLTISDRDLEWGLQQLRDSILEVAQSVSQQ